MAKYEIKVMFDYEQSFATERLTNREAKKWFVTLRGRFPEDDGYRIFVTKYEEEDVTEDFKRDTAVSVTYDVYVRGVQHIDQTFTLTYPSLDAANKWMEARNQCGEDIEIVQSSVVHNT